MPRNVEELRQELEQLRRNQTTLLYEDGIPVIGKSIATIEDYLAMIRHRSTHETLPMVYFSKQVTKVERMVRRGIHFFKLNTDTREMLTRLYLLEGTLWSYHGAAGCVQRLVTCVDPSFNTYQSRDELKSYFEHQELLFYPDTHTITTASHLICLSKDKSITGSPLTWGLYHRKQPYVMMKLFIMDPAINQ